MQHTDNHIAHILMQITHDLEQISAHHSFEACSQAAKIFYHISDNLSSLYFSKEDKIVSLIKLKMLPEMLLTTPCILQCLSYKTFPEQKAHPACDLDP